MEVFLLVAVVVGSVLFVQVGRELMASFLLIWFTAGCLYYAWSDFHAALTVFAVAIPFEQIFSAWGGGPWNLLTYVMALMILVGLTHPRRRPRARAMIAFEGWMLLWISWSMISLLWSPEAIIPGLKSLANEFASLLVVFAYYRWGRSREDVVRWLWYFLIGQFFVTVILLRYFDPGSAYVWNEARQRLIPNALALGTEISPNGFARAAIVGFVGALALTELSRTHRMKLVAIALAVFLGVTIPLTWSRTAVAAEALALLAWMGFAQRHRFRRLIVGIGLAAGLGAGAWYVNSEALLLRVNQTLYNDRLESITSGRSTIWAVAWELIEENPVVGVGYGGFRHSYQERTGDIARDDHNVYLQTFSETGVIGAGLFLGALLSLGLAALRTGAWRHVTVAWWLTFVAVIGAASMGRSKEFWLAFAITLLLAGLRAGDRRGPSATLAPRIPKASHASSS